MQFSHIVVKTHIFKRTKDYTNIYALFGNYLREIFKRTYTSQDLAKLLHDSMRDKPDCLQKFIWITTPQIFPTLYVVLNFVHCYSPALNQWEQYSLYTSVSSRSLEHNTLLLTPTLAFSSL